MLQINEMDWIRAILDLRDCSINVTLVFQVLNSGGHFILNLLLPWFGSSCNGGVCHCLLGILDCELVVLQVMRFSGLPSDASSLRGFAPLLMREGGGPGAHSDTWHLLLAMGRTCLLFSVKTNHVFLHCSSSHLRLKSWSTFKPW